MDPTATVLLTGGAGYIGSHIAVKLLENGNEVVIVDNCSNCFKRKDRYMPESILRVQDLTGKSVKFIPLDMLDQDELEMVFLQFEIDCVIHLAGFKSVSESVANPLCYYRNNVNGTITLLDVMKASNCRRLIYSSSATVYGDPEKLPLSEESPTGKCTNPYGMTKFVSENIMRDLCKSNADWKIISLRYFNPAGAHESGRIGEDPLGIPNNLIPVVSKVLVGKLPEINIFGQDYDTIDGTGVRDYIHIDDLVDGHVQALHKLFEEQTKGFKVYNLGTGKGHSVFEVLNNFEKVANKSIPFTIANRRQGDVAEAYCDCTLANTELKWFAKKTLMNICQDSWRWISMNPSGYMKDEPCSS